MGFTMTLPESLHQNSERATPKFQHSQLEHCAADHVLITVSQAHQADDKVPLKSPDVFTLHYNLVRTAFFLTNMIENKESKKLKYSM